MQRKTIVFGVCLLLPGLALHAQQKPSAALPATPPTALAPTAPAPVAPVTTPPQVTYQNGILTVTTDNSSLNQTLREIARKTGMNITGGVNEERIFGSYGPAKTGSVLRQLLDGTTSNMLFQEATATQAAHLTLSARQGSPTPPSVFAANQRRDQEDSFIRSTPPEQNNVPRPASPPPPQQGGVPIGSFGPPAQADGSQPSQQVNDGNDNGDNNQQQDQQQSPNGVKTPEQLLQQLMQMRQQQNGK